MAKSFQLLEPGPLVPDEPHQRGDVSLLDANGLGNIAQHVLSGRLPPADYQSRVPCLAPWRRKGTAYSLAPLGLQHPASARPSYAPLSKSTLDAAFTLQPGGYQLTEAEKGDLLQTNLGGVGAPAATGGASGGASAAAGGAAPAVTKIKLKVKASRDNKRRREDSGPPN